MLHALVWAVLAAAAHANSPAPAPATEQPCARAPPHAQPADARYALSVAGDPDLYLPGELYTGKSL